jgi:hypothetical protein
MRFNKVEIFPTTIMTVDVSDFITKSDQFELIEEIDKFIEDDILIDTGELTPKYQSLTYMFKEERSAVWKKLQKSFYAAVTQYFQNVENLVKHPKDIVFHSSNAWFYRGSHETQETSGNPWHNHTPSFLSGVFYLKLPTDVKPIGTEFLDPRHPSASVNRTYIVEPYELAWCVFPGWLHHKPGTIPKECQENRYIVAADCFVSR